MVKDFDTNLDSVKDQRKLLKFIKVHQRPWMDFGGKELHSSFLETLTDFDGNRPIKVENYVRQHLLFYEFQPVKVEQVDMPSVQSNKTSIAKYKQYIHTYIFVCSFACGI